MRNFEQACAVIHILLAALAPARALDLGRGPLEATRAVCRCSASTGNTCQKCRKAPTAARRLVPAGVHELHGPRPMPPSKAAAVAAAIRKSAVFLRRETRRVRREPRDGRAGGTRGLRSVRSACGRGGPPAGRTDGGARRRVPRLVLLA